MSKKAKNVSKATAVGVGAGGAGSVLIAYGASVLEAKHGVPVMVTTAVAGTLFAFITRWAAKLNPFD